jgi:anti-anti-sigma regulatory factor
MSAELECVATHGSSAAVLRVAGELSLGNAPRLRSAALKCLAEQPPALILDVAALTAPDDIQLTVLIAIARHAAAWPSIPILVCAPQPELAAALVRLRIDRHVLICADVTDAHVVAARQPLPPVITEHFAPVVAAVAQARHLVEGICERWHLNHLMSSAGLAATELVSNAVRHAGTGMELTVSRSRQHLHLAVRDYVSRPARLVGPSGEAEPGGRGLLVVEALVSGWGSTPTRDGKVTWASLRIR